jgi:uncharacterized membrane protein
MKNFELKKEIWIWLILLLPIVYLVMVWPALPEIVPTHFGMDGQPNDWSNKSTLIYLVAGMTAGMYLLFTIIPAIDPKERIKAMGNKYYKLKFAMMLFMSVLCIVIIRSAITGSIGDGRIVFLVVGALFMFLGNYMQTVKPNYFIGIRTPWTLENETVWAKTHRLGGKLYFVAGGLVMVLAFILKAQMMPVFIGIILTASVVPMVYSYVVYKKLKGR